MVGSRGILNMIMMVFGAVAVVGVLWTVFGYSAVFGDSFGGLGLLGDLTEYLGLGQLVAEDVRVAAHELVVAVVGHPREVAGAALLQQQRKEVDLEENVAELVEQLGVVASLRRIGQLVGLLHRVRDDRALVLLAVPGAVAPQAARQRVEARDSGGDVGLGHHPSLRRRRRSPSA